MDEMNFTNCTPAELTKAIMHFSIEEAQAKTNKDAAKRELDRRLGVGEYSYGKLQVKVKPQIKFLAALAKKNLTKAKYEPICVPKADATRARVLLDERDFLKCQQTYDNIVSVEFLKD